jgi:hypothetical protein
MLEVKQMIPGSPLIEGDYIRLLNIHPGGDGDLICATIFSVQLSESPTYEALSYTWGDLSRRQQIQVIHVGTSEGNAVLTWVTSSCYAALKRLRQGATSQRTVWVDSICIDQANVFEKNHQLNLMTRIYESASCVIVYLGESADGSDEAMDWIQEIDIPSNYQGERHRRVMPPMLDRPMLEALFSRPWFSRIWVIQEVRMARKALVYCGDRAVRWDGFQAFKHWNVSCHFIEELPYVIGTRPGRNLYGTPAQRLIIELHQTRRCQATDPRDKLYAILPLILQSETEDITEEFEAIRIDYRLSATQVFVSLGKYLLESMGPDILTEVVGPSALAGLPSWVPDWSISRDKYLRHSGDRLPWYHGGYEWRPRTSGTGVKVFEARTNNGEHAYQLHGQAKLVGSIIAIGGKCDLRRNVFPIKQWQSLIYDPRLSGWDCFWLSLGVTTVSEILESRILAYQREARRRATEGPIICESSKLPLDTGRTTLVDFCENGLVGTELVAMRRALSTCDGWRYFVTNTGLQGLSSEYAQIGDSVYWIDGASNPYVLRPYQEHQECAVFHEEQGRESKEPAGFTLAGYCSIRSLKRENIDTSEENIVIW